jgi:hypothetical protein
VGMRAGKNSLVGRLVDDDGTPLNGTGIVGDNLVFWMFRLRRRQSRKNIRRSTTTAPADPPTTAPTKFELPL